VSTHFSLSGSFSMEHKRTEFDSEYILSISIIQDVLE